ncbi:universal stress protein [uncultured Bilophila sp.]|uniref:universal stress protein n=1 Tax=uncultured Bilophila sp. TaxID=529385 RepID=UPI0026DA7E18|nr:universal stress protein [uncultured Bilophila sp.]
MELKKILCAVDLMDTVNPAVEYAKMLADMSGASVSVIYVISSRSTYENLQVPVEEIAKGMRRIWSRSREDMDAFVAAYFPGVDATGFIYEGKPAEKIVEIAREQDVDMIVMGTHAREGLDRLFFGSVANEVVKSSKCPVMTIRPEKKSE